MELNVCQLLIARWWLQVFLVGSDIVDWESSLMWTSCFSSVAVTLGLRFQGLGCRGLGVSGFRV